MEQLNLFNRDRELARAITSKGYIWRGAMPYLKDMIRAGRPLIHLFGRNPTTCLARSLNRLEPEVAKKRAWVSREDAIRVLKESNYYHHANLELLGLWGQIWRRLP